MIVDHKQRAHPPRTLCCQGGRVRRTAIGLRRSACRSRYSSPGGVVTLSAGGRRGQKESVIVDSGPRLLSRTLYGTATIF